MLHRFCLDDLAAAPWKNGGGLTREIASGGAGSDGFDWRVSVATIEADGPFSRFEGIDRTIMLLSGPGVHLCARSFDHELAQPLQPFEFTGDEDVHCTVLGGPSTDFNLMVRRGRGAGTVTVHQDTVRVQASGGVALAVGGSVHLTALSQHPDDQAGEAIESGCGVWWSTPVAQQFSPAPGADLVVSRWSPT